MLRSQVLEEYRSQPGDEVVTDLLEVAAADSRSQVGRGMTAVPLEQPLAESRPGFLDKASLVEAVLEFGEPLPSILLGAFYRLPDLAAFSRGRVATGFGRDLP